MLLPSRSGTTCSDCGGYVPAHEPHTCSPGVLEPRYVPEPCPTCGDSGEVHRVLTPKIDPRDPAFDYETFDCPDCKDDR